LQKPVVYQDIDGRRRHVAGSYLLDDAGDVTFQVGSYDTTRPLVIDPVLVYSTFLVAAATTSGSILPSTRLAVPTWSVPRCRSISRPT
jgi:hypothetical protein